MLPEITESWTSNGITVRTIESAQRLEGATRDEIERAAESIRLGAEPDAAVAAEVPARESP